MYSSFNFPAPYNAFVVTPNVKLIFLPPLFHLCIFLIADRLTPFSFCIFPRNLNGKVAELTVRGCAMPVLHSRRNIDGIARHHQDRLFSPFLIIAPACNTDQYLTPALIRMVDMPVIAAARFKSHIEDAHLLHG